MSCVMVSVWHLAICAGLLILVMLPVCINKSHKKHTSAPVCVRYVLPPAAAAEEPCVACWWDSLCAALLIIDLSVRLGTRLWLASLWPVEGELTYPPGLSGVALPARMYVSMHERSYV